MRLTLKIWRQPDADSAGRLVRYEVDDLAPSMSFLEMLDALNEQLAMRCAEPVAFDSDCREGICGMCGLVIDGTAHGPLPGTTTCQLHLRSFRDGQTVTIEPLRAKAFPVIKDLVVDRRPLDRIIAAGGYVTAPTGSAPEAHATPVAKADADAAFDAAACIGCGACVAACPNGSAMLFTAAKTVHLGRLPQGQPERSSRARAMLAAQDDLDFGGCSSVGACTSVCPQGIPLATIAALNRDVLRRPGS